MSSQTKKTVYFVRHGQSVDNASPVFQSVHSPLSEKGESQAVSIADRMVTVDFDALIASPLPRAQQTAEQIASKTGKEITFSDLFVERIKPTEIDGKPWTDEQARKTWDDWNKTLFTPESRVSDGENYVDMMARVDKALEFLLERPEATLVVVTHGYFLRAIIARVLMGDELTAPLMKRFQERASIENTAITVINYADAFQQDFAWRLWTLNDHSHFAE